MSFSWQTYRLDDLIVSRNQGVNTTTEKVEYSTDGIPVVRATNITPYGIDFKDVKFVDNATYERIRSECKPVNNDILYTNIGSRFGDAALVKSSSPFTIAWNVLRMVTGDDLDSLFLVYYLNNPVIREAIRKMSSSSTVPFVSGKTIGSLNMRVPQLQTQQKIASILSSLDDKIELNRRMNQTLEVMAQTLFREMCLPKGDELPEGWENSLVGNLARVKHGFAFKGEFFSDQETEYLLLTPGNFKIGGGFSYKKKKWYDGEIPLDYVLSQNDLIVTMTDLSKAGDTLGYSALVPEIAGKTLLHNQRIGLVECHDEKYKMYLYWLMRTEEYRSYILATASGSTVKHTAPSKIESFELIEPPNEVLLGFTEKAKLINKLINNNEVEVQTLTEIRDLLLPKLMSGEIEI